MGFSPWQKLPMDIVVGARKVVCPMGSWAGGRRQADGWATGHHAFVPGQCAKTIPHLFKFMISGTYFRGRPFDIRGVLGRILK